MTSFRTICESGMHCRTCRNPITGVTIRRKFVERYTAPVETPAPKHDGQDVAIPVVCPKGHAWGSKPPPPPPKPSAPRPAQPPQPVPPEKWPKWAKRIARFRRDGEHGIGDTVHRLAGRAGRWYERFRKLVKLPCRCPERRAEWNAKYPYSPQSLTLESQAQVAQMPPPPGRPTP